MSEQKLSAYEVLRYKFPAEEYVLIEEVSDASGFSRSRSLDYMLINLWNSRGLAITGIEKKSFRNDWQKELKNPAKQENHYKYCDYFYLLTDRENVAKMEEIPPTWGWYHINDKGILKTMKAAPQLTPLPVNRSFLCAMLRRAANKNGWIHEKDIQAQVNQRAETLQRQSILKYERLENEYKTLEEVVKTFESASGVSIRSRWTYEGNATEVGNAVRAILNGNVTNYRQNLQRVYNQIKNMTDGLESKISSLEEVEKLLGKFESEIAS